MKTEPATEPRAETPAGAPTRHRGLADLQLSRSWAAAQELSPRPELAVISEAAER